MQLTPHFTLAEFTASNTASAYGIDNEPTPEHLKNIQTCAEGLEQVRTLFVNRALVISSGYRNPQVNHLVGGVPTSAHALGFAADFHIAGWSDYDVARLIAASSLIFDQLIYEKGRCVHISFDSREDSGGPRRQVLSQPGGPGSKVLPGIQK